MYGYEPLGEEVMEAKLVDIHLNLIAIIGNFFPNKIIYFFSLNLMRMIKILESKHFRN